MTACIRQSFVHTALIRGECKVAVSYTPSAQLLDQPEWCNRLTEHAATTDAELVQSCARELVQALDPVRLIFKLERQGSIGETLQYTYSYARPKASGKRARTPSESDEVGEYID